MARIPQAFIDEVLDRSDIVELIDKRISLRRAGRNYSALCPFHKEKTPSFSVNADKQFYYCFGCGAGGNAIGFLMDYERLDFPEAVELLAHNCGLEVPKEETSQGDQQLERRRRDIYDILSAAENYYQQQLKSHPQAQTAIDYLKNRGLSGEIARQFGIGYAPPGWDNLLNTLATDSHNQQLLMEAGMLIEKEQGGYYDRFRDRIMFPIRDHRGRVIAFGGRVLGDEKPKYLNSPETEIFHKNRELYGLFEAKKLNRQIPRIIIVEGYMDVVALHQHGVSYATATLGTACSEQHLDKVFRQSHEVVFCFDGDEAGRKAADRALHNTLPVMQDGRSAKFLFLPEGEDPDSLIRQIGTEAFLEEVDQAQPLSEYLFSSVGKGLNLDQPDGRARLSKLAIPIVEKLPDGAFKHLMFDQLRKHTGLQQDDLNTLIELRHQQSKPAPSPQHEASGEPGAAQQSPVQRKKLQTAVQKFKLNPPRKALALLLHNPKLAQNCKNLSVLEGGSDTDIQFLLEVIQILHQEPDTTGYSLIGRWMNTDRGELLMRLLSQGAELIDHLSHSEKAGLDPTENAPDWNSPVQQEFNDTVDKLLEQPKEQQIAQLLDQLSQNKAITVNDLSEDQRKQIEQLFSRSSEHK